MTSPVPIERSFALPVALLLGAWLLGILAVSWGFFPGGIVPEAAPPPTWKIVVGVGVLASGAGALAWLGLRALTKGTEGMSGA